MRRKRWPLVVVLVLLILSGVALILWQPASEASKGQRARTDGQQLIKSLKKGKQAPHTKARRADTAVSIPSVGIDLAIYKTDAGLNYGALAELARVKPNTSPGDNNYVLAGHSSYVPGVLFANLFQLTTSQGYVRNAGAPYRPSDYKGGTGTGGLIDVYTLEGKYTYQADRAYTVEGSDASILSDPAAGSAKQIHLFTCPRVGYKHPAFRYVVQGHLVRVKPTKIGLQKHLDTSLTVTDPAVYRVGTLTSD